MTEKWTLDDPYSYADGTVRIFTLRLNGKFMGKVEIRTLEPLGEAPVKQDEAHHMALLGRVATPGQGVMAVPCLRPGRRDVIRCDGRLLNSEYRSQGWHPECLTAAGYAVVKVPEGVAVEHGARLVPSKG